jgi:hypothetical protein
MKYFFILIFAFTIVSCKKKCYDCEFVTGYTFETCDIDTMKSHIDTGLYDCQEQ